MVSGFGFALMAVPMMGLAVDLKTAVVVSTICGTGSNTFQAIKDGRSRDDRLVRLLVAASFLGMPFGIVVLDRVELDALRVGHEGARVVQRGWPPPGVRSRLRFGGSRDFDVDQRPASRFVVALSGSRAGGVPCDDQHRFQRRFDNKHRNVRRGRKDHGYDVVRDRRRPPGPGMRHVRGGSPSWCVVTGGFLASRGAAARRHGSQFDPDRLVMTRF
ncbi:MAG: hypothetical protein RLZZ199_1807 [Actinomycetota bacterium]